MTRPDLRVRTRAGFVGIADKPRRQLPDTAQPELLTALISPFHSGGIGLRLTPLFCNVAEKGSYIHTWLHVDCRDLAFQEDDDGWRKAVKQGFLLELMHAANTSGAYQVRAAVRDAASKKVGSAGQLLEIPDVSAEQLGLSGIEMRTVEKGGAEPADPALGPAVRRFAPGDPTHVFRDGQIVWTGEPHSLEASAVGDRREFTVARDLRFGADTPEGVYMLRVSARNRSGRKITATAVQWMDFELSKAARQ